MLSLNRILLLGSLTRPATFRQTARGTPVTTSTSKWRYLLARGRA